MYLYLVRHGEAEDPSINPARPLSRHGRMQAETIGRFMAENQVNVHAIWHSELFRAKETATIISNTIGARGNLEQREDLSPMYSIHSVEQSIREFDKHLMIVGHLPFMGNLLSKLLTGQENSSLVLFETASAACLTYSRGACSLRWLINPEQLI